MKTSTASGPAGSPASADLLAADVLRREGDAVGGGGEQGQDGVEQRRGADAVAAGREGQREDLAAGDGAAQPGDQVLLRDRAVLEEPLHQPVVGLGDRLDQARAVGLDLVREAGGDLGRRRPCRCRRG